MNAWSSKLNLRKSYYKTNIMIGVVRIGPKIFKYYILRMILLIGSASKKSLLKVIINMISLLTKLNSLKTPVRKLKDCFMN